MRANGITYDAGFINAGVSTHEPFDPEVVKREMRVIHDDLHCTAVHLSEAGSIRVQMRVQTLGPPFPAGLDEIHNGGSPAWRVSIYRSRGAERSEWQVLR
jgi:hypothetical protein